MFGSLMSTLLGRHTGGQPQGQPQGLQQLAGGMGMPQQGPPPQAMPQAPPPQQAMPQAPPDPMQQGMPGAMGAGAPNNGMPGQLGLTPGGSTGGLAIGSMMGGLMGGWGQQQPQRPVGGMAPGFGNMMGNFAPQGQKPQGQGQGPKEYAPQDDSGSY